MVASIFDHYMDETRRNNMEDMEGSHPLTRPHSRNKSNHPSPKNLFSTHCHKKMDLCDILYKDMNIKHKRRNHQASELRHKEDMSHDGIRNATWGNLDILTGVNTNERHQSQSHVAINNPLHSIDNMQQTRKNSSSCGFNCDNADNGTRTAHKSSLDTAKRLQEGIDELLDLLQSTSFVGTIDPEYHAPYLKIVESEIKNTEEEKSSSSSGSVGTTDCCVPTTIVFIAPTETVRCTTRSESSSIST